MDLFAATTFFSFHVKEPQQKDMISVKRTDVNPERRAMPKRHRQTQ